MYVYERENQENEVKLSAAEIMDLLCAPEPTDDWSDIEFDDDGTDEGFIERWIREERAVLDILAAVNARNDNSTEVIRYV